MTAAYRPLNIALRQSRRRLSAHVSDAMAYTQGHANEAELRAFIREALRKMGWVVVDTSSDKKTRGGMRNFPDLFCVRHGRTMLIETKYGRNDRTEGQRAFAAEIEPHLSAHLIYCVARSWDDVACALGLI